MSKKPADARAGLLPNKKLYDKWSLIHIGTGIFMGWLLAPMVAIIIMACYEPIEVKLISPFAGRHGIVFGYEAWQNSLSDIFFDGVGILIGTWLLTHLVAPPFHFF
jgi:hypothetical protein